MFDFYIQELLICLNLSGDRTTFCASACEHVHVCAATDWSSEATPLLSLSLPFYINPSLFLIFSVIMV